MHKFPILVLMVILLTACNKVEEAEELSPDEFSVKVLREPTTAFLSWDDAVAPIGDTLTFSIELGGRTLIHNLTQTQYIIEGLIPKQSYSGKVVATNKKGLQRIADFELIAYQEQLLVSDFNSSIGSYDVTGRPSWLNSWHIVGTPVISNDSLLIVQDSDNVFALKLSDGKVFWRKELGAVKQRNPICHDGIVYVDSYKKLNAISTIDGSIIWSVDCNSRRDLAFGNGTLYLLSNVANSPYELKAIHPKTGVIKWSVTTRSGILSAMVAKNGMVYLTSAEVLDKPGYLYAYDASTGAEKWRYQFTGASLFVEESGAPVILNDIIYIPVEQGYSLTPRAFVHAVNTNNGKLVWQQPLENIYSDIDELAVDATGVYACGYRQLTKLNPTNGAVIWSKSGDFNANITVSKEYVFAAAGSRKSVNAYSTTTGDLKRKISGFTNCWFSPVVYKDNQAYYPANSSMSVKH